MGGISSWAAGSRPGVLFRCVGRGMSPNGPRQCSKRSRPHQICDWEFHRFPRHIHMFLARTVCCNALVSHGQSHPSWLSQGVVFSCITNNSLTPAQHINFGHSHFPQRITPNHPLPNMNFPEFPGPRASVETVQKLPNILESPGPSQFRILGSPFSEIWGETMLISWAAQIVPSYSKILTKQLWLHNLKLLVITKALCIGFADMIKHAKNVSGCFRLHRRDAHRGSREM